MRKELLQKTHDEAIIKLVCTDYTNKMRIAVAKCYVLKEILNF